MKDIKNHSTLTDNLVSYWHLGDGGGVRYDQHGSNHLSDRNTVGYEKGLHGNCASFNRANGELLHLETQDQGIFTTGEDVSFCVWFNTSEDFKDRSRFISVDRSGSGVFFDVQYRGNLNRIDVYYHSSDSSTGSALFTDVNLSINKWYFIVVTIDASTGITRLYLKDNKNQLIADTTSTNNKTGFYYIDNHDTNLVLSGFYNAGTGNFDSEITQKLQSLGLWSGKLLSDSEIDDLYNYGTPLLYDALLDFDTHDSLKSSLVFWHNLNERNGVYQDSSSNSHNLVALPFNHTSLNTLPARKGSYLTLDGSQNGYLKEDLAGGQETRIMGTGDFSLAAMVNIDGLVNETGEYALFSTRHSTERGGFSLNIVRNTGALKLYYGSNSSDTVNTLTTSTYLTSLLGEDVFIGVSVDVSSRTIRVYINGRERTDIVLGSGVTNMSGHHGLVVGQPYVNTIGDALKGNISKIGYWDKIVTEDEFKDIYNMGAAIWYKVPTTIKPHNSLYKELEAYWEFEEDTGNDRVASTGLLKRRLKDESSSDVLKVTGKIRQGAVRAENTATKRTALKLEHNPLDSSPNNFLDSPLSIVHWYKPKAITNATNSENDTFIDQWGSSDSTRNIRYLIDRSSATADEIEFDYQNGSNSQTKTFNLGQKLTANEWYQFALIFDGENKKLSFRLNTALIDTTTLSYSSMNPITRTIYIFKQSADSRYSSCDMDALAIYRKVLAEGDLFEMFNSGTGIHYRSNPTTASQISSPSLEFNTGTNIPEKRANYQVNQNLHDPLVLGVPNQYNPGYDLILPISLTPTLDLALQMAHAAESFYRTRAGTPPSLALRTYMPTNITQRWKSKELDDTENEWITKPHSFYDNL